MQVAQKANDGSGGETLACTQKEPPPPSAGHRAERAAGSWTSKSEESLKSHSHPQQEVSCSLMAVSHLTMTHLTSDLHLAYVYRAPIFWWAHRRLHIVPDTCTHSPFVFTLTETITCCSLGTECHLVLSQQTWSAVQEVFRSLVSIKVLIMQ